MALFTQEERIALAERLEKQSFDPKFSKEKQASAARSARSLRNLWAYDERKAGHIGPETKIITLH